MSRTPRRTDDVRVVRLHVTSVNERVGLNGEYKKRCVTESVDVMTLREICECPFRVFRRAVELESGFLEAMESQGDALELSASSTLIALVSYMPLADFGSTF